MDQLLLGLVLGVAAVLVIAAVPKIRRTAEFEIVLVSLAPGRLWRPPLDSRRAARAVIVAELLPAALAVTAGPAGACAASFGVLVGLSFAVVIARRRDIPCSCFGRSDRPANRYQVGRTLALTALAGALVIAVSAGAPVAPASGADAVAVMLALAVACLAVLPEAAQRATMARSRETQPPRARMNRRTMLRSLLLGAAAVVVGATAVNPAAATARRPCSAQFDLCYGCTTKTTHENDVACCIDCYAGCQGAGAVCAPGAACGGCWPGP